MRWSYHQFLCFLLLWHDLNKWGLLIFKNCKTDWKVSSLHKLPLVKIYHSSVLWKDVIFPELLSWYGQKLLTNRKTFFYVIYGYDKTGLNIFTCTIIPNYSNTGQNKQKCTNVKSDKLFVNVAIMPFYVFLYHIDYTENIGMSIIVSIATTGLVWGYFFWIQGFKILGSFDMKYSTIRSK